MFDIFYKEIKERIAKIEEKIKKMDTEIRTVITDIKYIETKTDILQKQINNIPLIKRYQKTLDILEKTNETN